MNVAILFEIFRANELSVETRIRIIKSMGRAINDTLGMNLTEAIVYELVKTLDPDNPIGIDDHYSRYIKAKS